ncbi:MAG: metal-dependent hydrolase [Firmicutes bacterium]|nr:metal-dependent hydrolase [Bacillota bacterium]
MPNSVKWLGHAACQITSAGGRVVLIDPWISGNPSCPVKKEALSKADVILITHDHFDHLGADVPDLVRATGAMVAGQPELMAEVEKSGVAAEKTLGMNIGGQVDVAGIKITMTQAFHSAGAGAAVGYIVTLEDGKHIYHAGDTGIFASMELLGRIYPLAVALLPIGSLYTMDPLQAAYSAGLLKPAKVIPIHYGTFPALVQNADDFVKLAAEKAPGVSVEVLKPGQETIV